MGKSYTLDIRQSPSVVEYTVSTRRSMKSDIAFMLLKVIITCAWIALTAAHYTSVILFNAYTVSTPIYVAATLLCITGLLVRPYKTESLLVLRSYGLQVSSSSRFYLCGHTKFIPKSEVLEIVIQEAFIGFEIKYILVIVILSGEKLEVVFKDCLPRLDDLEMIWQGAKECYYEK